MKNILPSEGHQRRKWVIAIIVIVVLAFFYWVGTRDEQTAAQGRGRKASTPQKTVEASGGFKLATKTAGACQGFIPEGWAANASPRSDAVDFISPDRTMYAGYGIFAVNPSLQIYGGDSVDIYSNDPETSIRKLAGLVIRGTFGDRTSLSFTGEYNEQIGAYHLRSLESGGSKGVVFYRIFPGDGFNYSYIEAVRFAFTKKHLWNTKGLLVARIASSLSCTTRFVRNDAPVIGAKTSKKAKRDGEDRDYGYNPQLGTEYVHDSKTGENYLVSPDTNWSPDGPQGAGYYKPAGTEFIKLDPGRADQ